MIKLSKKNLIKIGITGIGIIGLVTAGLVYLNTRGDVEGVHAGWYNDNWSYRKQIVINSDYVTGDLTDFPVLISFTDAQVASHTQSTGGDIIFIDSEGKKLSHEIESFATSSTGAFVGWVKIPQLSSTDDTVINMYYGNAGVSDQQDTANVWSDDYLAVWHLASGDVSASTTDSSMSGNDGSPYNTANATTTGKINSAFTFDGNSDYIKMGKRDIYDDIYEGTISAWAKWTPNSSFDEITNSRSDTNTAEFEFAMYNNNRFEIWTSDQCNPGGEFEAYTTVSSPSEWHYLVYTTDSSGNSFYVDGDKQTATYVTGASTTNYFFGHCDTGTSTYYIAAIPGSVSIIEYFPGIIDEVRYSSKLQSAAYIKTSYNNQNSPTTFLSVQAEETGPGPVGHWTFDEGYGTTAYDESGQGNDGTITGALWQDESMCVSGKCLYFDGSNDYVNVTDASTLNITEGTVAAWVKSATTTTGKYIIAKDPSSFTYIDSCSGYNGGNPITTVDCSSSLNVQDGDLLVVHVGWQDAESGNTVVVAKDSGSPANNFTFDAEDQAVNSNDTGGAVGYALSAAADSSATFRFTVSADSRRMTIVVLQFRPTAGYTVSKDTSNIATGNGTALASGQISTADANEVIIGGGSSAGGAGFESQLIGGAAADGNTDANDYSTGWYKIVSSLQSNITAQVTGGAGDLWVCNIISFQAKPATPYALSTAGGGQFMSATNTVTGMTDINDNNWHHISGTYDGSDMKIYIDGMLENTNSNYSGDLPIVAGDLRIGADYQVTPANFFHGFIDEVKIYPYARTADEIKQDYAAGLAGIKSNTGVAASFGSQSDKWLTDGLVGYWKMDESATTSGAIDSSGNSGTGTYNGQASTTAGKFGNGAVFHEANSSDTVQIPESSTLKPTEAFTLAAWVKPVDYAGSRETVISLSFINADGDGYALFSNEGSPDLPCLQVNPGDPSYDQICGDSALPNDEWSHIVSTWEANGLMRFYVNGVLNNTASTRASIDYSDVGDLYLGSLLPSRSEYFGGVIDEARVYNRALSPREVKKLYEWAPGPVAWWKFDEMSGGTAYDSVASSSTQGGHDGTLVGDMTWGKGKYGGALHFGGNDDYLDFGRDLAAGSKTVTAWINMNYINTGEILGGYFFRIDDNGYPDQNTYGTSYENAEIAIAAKQWHHVAVAVNAGDDSVVFYVNGIPSGATSTNKTGAIQNQYTVLGADDSTTPLYDFNGYMDDVRIYNYALTPAQINAVMAGQGPGVSSADVGGEPYAHFSMDEGYGSAVHDEAGNITDGTITEATWQDESMCISGRCLHFDGSGDYVNFGDISSFDALTNMTISAWVNVKSVGSSVYILSKYWPSGTDPDRSFLMRINPTGVVEFEVSDGSGNDSVVSKGAFGNEYPLNQWHLVSGTWNGPSQSIYFNGVLDKTSSCSELSLQNNDDEFCIGIACQGGDVGVNGPFDGFIDEVKIYPYPQTQEQILKEYNAGKAGIKSSRGAAISLGSRSKSWLTDGLVGYWKMDEAVGTYDDDSNYDDAIDSSGSGNTGSAAGSASTTAGKFGNGGGFDGYNDYINVGNDSSLSLSGAMSICTWMYAVDIPAGDENLIVTNWSGSELHYGFSAAESNELAFYWSPNGSDFEVHETYTDVVSEDQWYHVCAVRVNEDNVKIYVDGAEMPVTSGGDYSIPSSAGDTTISENTDAWEGQLDELRIYNRALSPVEVRALYEWAPGPVLELKFDELTGTTTYDTSGYGNDGVFVTQASSPRWTQGKYGGGLWFDGSDDYVHIDDDSSLTFGDGSNDRAFSATAWAYMRDSTDFDVFSKTRTTAASFETRVRFPLGLQKHKIPRNAGFLNFMISALSNTHLAGPACRQEGIRCSHGLSFQKRLPYSLGILLRPGRIRMTGAFCGWPYHFPCHREEDPDRSVGERRGDPAGIG
jgi:hypothetical protein